MDADYGQASIATVDLQLGAWYSFYPGDIAGIFFNRVSDAIPRTTTKQPQLLPHPGLLRAQE